MSLATRREDAKRSNQAFSKLSKWQPHQVSPERRLDREMRRRLILQETWFTRLRWFTSFFIDVDTFYLFLNWFSARVSDNQKYLSGSRLYVCINTRKFKDLDSREITSLPYIERVIYMHVISIIAENKSHAHHNTHLHTLNHAVASGLNEQHGNLFKS